MSASAAANAGLAGPPPRAPGERFHCRIDVEDICISVEGNATSSTTALFWEEVRVACRFNGISQHTRWMALQLAMDEAKKELQAASSGGDVSGAAAPQTGGLLALPYTAFNNMSYEVEFTAVTPDDPAVMSVKTVKPKRFHLMEFEVEAQNLHRVYSAVGGSTGDRAPTSGNMEVISASLNKKAAKVSAWTRSIFSKLGSSEKKEDSVAPHHSHSSMKERNEAAIANLSDRIVASAPTTAIGDAKVHEGIYAAVMKHIDVSEAYNRPGGRQCYCLVVKPESRKLPEVGVGTPLAISFTVVAHYGYTASVPRNYHNFAIVVDQFVLDYSGAARVLPPDPKDSNQAPRIITGYAFGYTANTTGNPNAMDVTSNPVPVNTAPMGAAGGGDGGTAMCVVDFDRLHKEGDERKRTPEDYKAWPTSCCVVSGSMGNPPTNRARLGNRVLCVSRFKTSPDGLCKPSFKCQFAISLVRFYGASGQSVCETAAPINLAALMNEEMLPQRIRTVKFELGEIMFLRLRRFSFAEPELLRAPLLLPYDYNNTNVQLPAPAASPRPAPRQQQRQQAQNDNASQGNSTELRGDALPPLPLSSQQQPAGGVCVAAAPTQTGLVPGEPPGASFASASSSSSTSSDVAPASPQAQRSESDESTPHVVPQPGPTAPFFTLEPQGDALALQFGPSGIASASVKGNPQLASAHVYDPMVAAVTAWGSHSPPGIGNTASAVEVTPSAPNAFLFTEHRVSPTAAGMPSRSSATAQQSANPYRFDAPEGGDGSGGEGRPPTSVGFELTPFE
ncbi:hypothetical protein ABL78_4916 [Leptomonas seymouri]|uniref:Uncharacterized protein n=1 Tax=Leptomonas seymouri TaxID=5684 RepID=A0A0N1IK98_LEPSE|nr:hypothetical protein ABL78_4916 [Leptomonas seymouri]|eukprot:KPI86013.1 hypothetical protein ABL78_4916 [Leptomonas seymouri]